VWLVHGYPGLEKFRSSRKRAIAQDPDTKDGDWFYNGHGEVLPVVLETIDGLNLDFRVSDHVTKSILEELVKRMLDIPDARPSARQLYVYATRICKRTSNSGPAQPPPPPSAALPTPTVEIAVSSDPYVSSSGPSPQLTTLPVNGPSLRPTSTVVPTAQSTAVTNAGSQSTSTPNLNVPVQTPSGTNPSPYPSSTSGSVTSANTAFTTSTRSSTPTPSIPQSSSSRRPSLQQGNPGSTRTQLPNLRVEIAEKWISERKAGRLTALPHDDLLRRLETRDHIGICSN
jgi:hypothetical protein